MSGRATAGVVEHEPTEARAKAAHKVHSDIVRTVGLIRTAWVHLAEKLWDFTELSMWRDLGYTSLEQWLASPEIELSRRHVYYLLEVWRELVLKGGVEPRQLNDLNMWKVVEVLPAVRRGHVELEAAIADCKTLGRDDLREKYATSTAAKPPGSERLDASTEPEYAICHACGSRYRVAL